jgi:phospholipid/cholesterol/gamma-HCH transport system substrate-binding protein
MSSNRQFVLGVFFVVALSILAFYTLFLTDFSLFREPIVMTAEFPNANALRDGDPVLVAGKRIGRVKGIEFRPQAEPERRIRVVMNLDTPIEMLAGYAIRIEDSTFLGGHNVAIDPGPFGGPPAQTGPDGVYRGSVRKSPLAALEAVGDLVSDNREAVSRILGGMDETINAVRTGNGLAGRLIYDEELANDVAAAATDMRTATADLKVAVAEARGAIESIRAGEGTLGRLLADRELYDKTLATVESLQTVAADLAAGSGLAGALLHDDELAAEVRRVVDDVSTVTRGLASGEGTLGRLLRDPELAGKVEVMITSFAGAGEDLRGIAATLRGNDGTLGKLLNDPALYEEALTALKVLTRSLEDYRESAPVSAFTTAIFGAL